MRLGLCGWSIYAFGTKFRKIQPRGCTLEIFCFEHSIGNCSAVRVIRHFGGPTSKHCSGAPFSFEKNATSQKTIEESSGLAILRPIWARPGLLWAVLGCSWAAPGLLWVLLNRSELFWAVLGCSGLRLGCSSCSGCSGLHLGGSELLLAFLSCSWAPLNCSGLLLQA